MRSAPAAIICALSFGQPCRGLTSRSRDRPKLAMARAAAPIFSPSCGSTRTTTGPGVSTQRLVLSVPAPGMQCSSAGKCPQRAAPAQASRLRQAAAPYPAETPGGSRRTFASARQVPTCATISRHASIHLLTRLLPTECGCYRARAELPSVEFPVGDVRAENNSFEGPREKPFHRARQCSVSGRPKQARRPEVQACQISKSCGQRSMKPRRSRPIPCCRSSKPSWARRACP